MALNQCSSNSFDSSFRSAREWSDYYGRPIHVGEFGAYSFSDAISRARFYREMRECMDRRGFGWASWDWKSGFYYWDRNAGAPAPGMKNAFFPAPLLQHSADSFRLDSPLAIGKTVIIQRSVDLLGDWTGIHTQSLVQPDLDYQPDTGAPQGVFRLLWQK